MYQYDLSTLSARQESGEGAVLILLTSEELRQSPKLAQSKISHLLCHTPTADSARVCKAELHHGCLCGTILTPRRTKEGLTIAFGYLLHPGGVVLCDDTGVGRTMIQHLSREEAGKQAGGFFGAFLEWLIARDMHHLQELEDQLASLEDQVLAGQLEDFTPKMTALRKETAAWVRYYTQMENLVCEFQDNEGRWFDEAELRLFHIVEKRLERLNAQAQMLREYGVQVRELFQAEIDIHQNQIMKILTIVTTIFLPLSLVAGWYGMNFAGMPELRWRYGYPAIIGVSLLVVLGSLWVMKKKKFW